MNKKLQGKPIELPDALHEVARTLVDASDVDIHLWMGRNCLNWVRNCEVP